MPHRKRLSDALDWSLLNTFRIIVEEEGISRAAVRLNLTQSAVSHALKRLETQIGVRLVDRSYKNFQLTAQGRALFKTASEIYRAIAKLDDSLDREEHAVSGTLRLLVLSRIVSEVFDEFLVLFRQQHPHVKLSIEMLTSADIHKQIAQNIAALGIALCRKEMRFIHRTLLIPEQYSLYCGKHHPLFTQRRVEKEHLLSQSFVTFFSEQWGDALSPLAVFRDEEQFRGKVVASSNNFDEVKRLLYAGYGIGCLPDNSVEQDVRNGLLRRIPLETFIAEIPIYLIWNKNRKLKPVEKAFIRGLLAAFAISEPIEL